MDVWSSALCFNTYEAEARELPRPESWADLADPAFAGQVAMPDPASSGTCYLTVSGWLQMMGEEKGWAFMDALRRNIASYTHSGSKPCRQAGAGACAVGLSFEHRADQTQMDGAPIDVILPRERLGWDMEATGIMAATEAPKDAKKLADRAASPEANVVYAQNFAVVALPGVAPKLEYVPGHVESLLIKNDFTWAAESRERILAE